MGTTEPFDPHPSNFLDHDGVFVRDDGVAWTLAWANCREDAIDNAFVVQHGGWNIDDVEA